MCLGFSENVFLASQDGVHFAIGLKGLPLGESGLKQVTVDGRPIMLQFQQNGQASAAMLDSSALGLVANGSSLAATWPEARSATFNLAGVAEVITRISACATPHPATPPPFQTQATAEQIAAERNALDAASIGKGAASDRVCNMVLGALCSKGLPVKVLTTTFSKAESAPKGTLRVLPLNEAQRDSLQFSSIAQSIQNKLWARGFSPPNDPGRSDYVAYITYGIDNGHSSFVSVPNYGWKPGSNTVVNGSAVTFGSVTSFNGTATTMPEYGQIGSSVQSLTTYRRALSVDIYDVRNNQPEKVYEIRSISDGQCGNIDSVLEAIAIGALARFPSINGKAEQLDVRSTNRC